MVISNSRSRLSNKRPASVRSPGPHQSIHLARPPGRAARFRPGPGGGVARVQLAMAARVRSGPGGGVARAAVRLAAPHAGARFRGQAVGWHRRATANTTTRSTAGSSSAGRGCHLRLRLRHSADCRAGPVAGRHCCC